MVRTYSTETQTIDASLAQACWTLRSSRSRTPIEGGALAIRSRTQEIARQEPYLLAVGGQVLGVVHVVPQSEGVFGFERQTHADELRLGGGLRCVQPLLPYSYYSNGTTTAFTNWLEPEPRARRVSGFHRPDTLLKWSEGGSGQGEDGAPGQLQRALLHHIPTQPLPLLDASLLTALRMLDQSLVGNRQRTLLAPLMGSDPLGLAYACAERMVRFGGTRSLLFLVSPGPGMPFLAQAAPSGLTGEAGALTTRHRALLSAGALYSLEGAKVFACDVEHMARRLAGTPPELPLEAFDTIFAFGMADQGHQADFQRILAYFDAVIVGFSPPTPCSAFVELFNGNVCVPPPAEHDQLQLTRS